jgi:hypothetical protein
MNKKIFSILAALVLSLIIWVSVSLSNNYVTKITVPVKVVNIPEGFIVGSSSVSDITVNVKGEGWKLLTLMWGSKPPFQIPLTQGTKSETVLLKDAIKENDWLTNGLQVFDINPSTFKFDVEKMSEKEIRVYPDVNLNFKPEYGLASKINILPETIRVYGPKGILSNLDSVPTVNREYKDLDNNVEDKIDIKQIDNLKYSSRTFDINFEVQKIVDKSFNDLDVTINNIPKSRDVVLFPNKITIVLRGGIDILSKITDKDFHPYIDYQTLIMDTTGTVEPVINKINYVKLIDIKPQYLKYIIKKY